MQKESRHVRGGEVRVIRRCVQKTFVLEERAALVNRSFPSLKKTPRVPKRNLTFRLRCSKKILREKVFFLGSHAVPRCLRSNPFFLREIDTHRISKGKGEKGKTDADSPKRRAIKVEPFFCNNYALMER